jgi:Protein of unknown function (DUF3551)
MRAIQTNVRSKAAHSRVATAKLPFRNLFKRRQLYSILHAPTGDMMRGLVWLISGIAIIFAAPSAWAQTYDPSYPVCMEAYGSDGSRIECFFTSMAQCKEGTQAFAGICFNNPYYVAPAAEAAPAAQAAPAPSATPARSPRR